MASYVVVPKTLNINEIDNNKFILAPSRYSKFIPKNKNNFVFLKDCVFLSTKRKRIKPNQKYYYIEIGDINVNSGYPNYKLDWGYKLPSNSLVELKKNDIVISTVRTYRKGIGFIDKLENNIVGTSAFLVIRDIKDNVFSKEYLFSLLRHDFFIEQILSLQNRGMYPRIDKDNLHLVFIPKPRNEEEHHYITVLTKAVINKEKEIRRKHKLILEMIEKELLENQKPNKFEYKLPDINKIENTTRVDAGYYSKDYLEKQFYVKNYKLGAKKIIDWGFNVKRGQNLQISAIGKSIYTDVKKQNFYTLIRPTNFTDYGTIAKFEYLGNPKDLSTLEKGDIVFSGEGTIGKCVLFPNINEKWITNIHGIILNKEDHNIVESAFVSCFIRFLRDWRIFDYISVGGQGGSLAMKYWDDIYVSNFPESKQKEIAGLYYNPVDYPTNLNLDNFLEEDTKWNKKAGILQLDQYAKKLKERLNEVIHQIVMDKKVKVDFEVII